MYVLLIFEVHQPFRLRQNLFWKNPVHEFIREVNIIHSG
jgi:hypothetical protein